MTPKRPDHGTPLPPGAQGDEPTRAATHVPLLEEDLTREIIGAFYTVYNVLGYGFLESVYMRARCVELTRRGLRVQREVLVEVFYAGVPVGRFRVDALVESRVVIEGKATRALTAIDRQQLLNGLRCSNLEVGLLLHFGPRPSFQRVVAEHRPAPNPAVSASSASS